MSYLSIHSGVEAKASYQDSLYPNFGPIPAEAGEAFPSPRVGVGGCENLEIQRETTVSLA